MATYKKLFSVEFNHDYYPENQTNDFTVTPTVATAKALKGLKLLFKQGTHGFSVLYLEDDITLQPKQDITAATLSFQMILNNPLFLNFTTLDAGYRKTVIDRFTNADGEGALAKTSEALSAQDKIGNVFANIDISDIGHTGESYPLEYKIDYVAMTRFWEYYVVLPNDDDVQLRIEDTEIDFSETRYPLVEFEDGVPQTVGEELSTIYFKSTVAIKTYQEPKKKLALEQNTKLNGNNNDYDPIIDHLPNPEIRSLNSTVYVYI